MGEQDERTAITEVEDALGGPIVAVGSALPADGPRTLWRGERGVAWVASEARIRDERAGAGIAHPLRPTVLGIGARAIALEGRGEPLEDPIDALVRSVPGERVRARATVRAHLEALGGPVSPARALARAVGRSKADRLLARELDVETGVGPILGGVDPRWIRSGTRGPISLSMRRAQQRGWAALDLAAADVLGLGDLRAVHEGDEAAYDLALLAIALREHTIARDESALERAREIVDRMLPRTDVDAVAVQLADAPSWLDRARFEGDRVPLAEARRIVRELDGLSLGGTRVRVVTTPEIRAGRAAPPWRPRGERRRELFSRWAEGIEADDEGLFSATPEALADVIARGLRGTVIDATCGIGAISLALARSPEVDRVIAIDRDPDRLAMARHNAGIYGVSERIGIQ